jgi:FMN reductase
MSAPLVVGIGGSARPGSTTDCALRLALHGAERAGARTVMFGGAWLARLPLYVPCYEHRTPETLDLLDAVRAADGVIIASPGYHGGVSGLVKNALDYLEDLREDARPYLDSRAIGLLVTAFGWQACASTLAALRAIAHALRGWPTPLGAMLNTADGIFDPGGACTDPKSSLQIELMARQVVDFTRVPSPTT